MAAAPGGSRGEASREGEPEAPSHVFVYPRSHARVDRTVQVTDNILVDVDVHGRALGVEKLSGPEMTSAEVKRWAAAGERQAKPPATWWTLDDLDALDDA